MYVISSFAMGALALDLHVHSVKEGIYDMI